MSTSCDSDVVAWANEQAALLRAGKFSELDIEHIADEVEDVGKSELRELETRMAVLLAHLAKWAFQLERRGASGRITIRSQRKAIERSLINTRSLTPELNDPEFWLVVWGDATRIATNETGFQDFPETCPWTVEQVRDPDFLPD